MSECPKSFTRIDVLNPVHEFETLKYVLLRERLIQQLRAACAKSALLLDPKMCDLVDRLRLESVECVEALDLWEQSQLSYPHATPFMWNNQDYLEKMLHDCDWVQSYAPIREWLAFNLVMNPFFMPQELLEVCLCRHPVCWCECLRRVKTSQQRMGSRSCRDSLM
jgi:hypothetical protein